MKEFYWEGKSYCYQVRVQEDKNRLLILDKPDYINEFKDDDIEIIEYLPPQYTKEQIAIWVAGYERGAELWEKRGRFRAVKDIFKKLKDIVGLGGNSNG